MDLDSEQFMTLLTDALRAGPGSPEWHQAVGALKTAGAAGDEFQMLVRAREDLESGRGFRAVTAGPGFTRKVMEGIEAEGDGKSSGLPSANLIGLLAAGVILAVVVVIAVVLFKTPPVENQAVEQLRGIYFINPVAQANFEKSADVPAEWKLVGEVPLKVGDKRLAPATTQPSKADKVEYRAGAIVLSESIPPDQARMLDVTLRVNKATDAIIPEVFVAEGPFDDAKAGSARELVWLLKGTTAQVALADQTVPAQGDKLDGKRLASVNVKVRIDKETVIVESGDKRIYEGPHKLSPTTPRYVGVRFRRKVGDGSDGVGLTIVNVLKP